MKLIISFEINEGKIGVLIYTKTNVIKYEIWRQHIYHYQQRCIKFHTIHAPFILLYIFIAS